MALTTSVMAFLLNEWVPFIASLLISIAEWVQEHYGLHVSNLSIAQVKQKYGIIERENYNKPKSPNSKQPGTSDMRIKAIEEAMRHFQMI